MFQQTIERLQGLDWHDLIIVCNEEHRFLVAEQLRQIGIENATILLEPVARNTAPAIAMTAYEAIRRNEEAVLLVLPSDHVMEDASTFRDTIKRAMPIVEKGKLVTFGIVPETPKTCYGYIHRVEKSTKVYSRLTLLLKNSRQGKLKNIRKVEIFIGTAACSFFMQKNISRSSKHMHRKWRNVASKPLQKLKVI